MQLKSKQKVINAEAFQLTKTMTLDNEILIPQ